jgi:twinkle protein
MKVRTFAAVGIEIPIGREGEIDALCPECSSTRKKNLATCLSVNTIDGTWCCHHCGWSGVLGLHRTGYGALLRPRAMAPPPPRVYAIPAPPPTDPLPESVIRWFADRGIPEPILIAAGITAGHEWCPQLAGYVLAIRFPYVIDGRLVNIKYRASMEKLFWLVKGAQRVVYGFDDIAGAETICIVEGEIDKLSIDMAGGPPTVSVPDGAPPPATKHYASKFAYLDEATLPHLHSAETVFIGTDMDAPGQTLANELARRIGPATCKRVSWHPYKDANDMLVGQGSKAVRDALAVAASFPASLAADIPQRPRPVRLLPSVTCRRPIITLSREETMDAR